MSPAPVLPAKSGCASVGKVDLRHRVVQEERLARLDVALHERDAALGGFAIDCPPRLHVERLHVRGRLPRAAFPDERRVRLRSPLRDGGLRFVAGTRNAVELVEALMGRLARPSGRSPPRCHLPKSAVA